MMTNQLSSDKPVVKKEDDRFQRYNFSKRIADTIINRKSTDCITIGIYGSWGEGKTSVLNFINEELSKNDNIISINFNPWRFSNENELLYKYFQTIAKILDKELHTKTEKIGKFIEKYGSIADVLRINSETIGNALSEVDLEILKERVNELLNESSMSQVIFIDDIDRLDKSEIFSLFRLVKLTADFSKTVYILSFDKDMVASAIGARYGEGDTKSGYDFLDKIIQVPLNIPKAQPDDLKKYCFELLDDVLNECSIELDENDAKRLVSEFSENVLIMLKTPRLAIRYKNTISFSLPLLKGEVNHVDLLLLEAIKIFYPKHYEFIKNNSHYLLSRYSRQDSFSSEISDKKKKKLIEHLDSLGINLNKKERDSIKSLLSELFPRLKEAFQNFSYSSPEVRWFKEKRIASQKYYQRYFTYSVLKGEISDISFDYFLKNIENSNVNDLSSQVLQIIKDSSVYNFLYKIRTIEESFNWNQTKIIIQSLGSLGDSFPDEQSSYFLMGLTNPQTEAAIFIYQLLKKHNENTECFSTASALIKNAKPIDFAYEINRWLKTGKSEEDKIFSQKEYNKLENSLLKRTILEANGKPIFEKFPSLTSTTFRIWKSSSDQEYSKYLKNILEKEPKKVLELLKSLIPTTISSNYPKPYISNMSKAFYENIIALIDKEYIYKIIIRLFKSDLENEKVSFSDLPETQTDFNILRQYIHWYEKETNL